jgi:hypothetical protein
MRELALCLLTFHIQKPYPCLTIISKMKTLMGKRRQVFNERLREYLKQLDPVFLLRSLHFNPGKLRVNEVTLEQELFIDVVSIETTASIIG